jgi:hypothetical protein
MTAAEFQRVRTFTQVNISDIEGLFSFGDCKDAEGNEYELRF